jgi:DNA-binding PadR family transcriptional regulator
VGRAFLGEFEQRVLLAILRSGDQAFALEVRRQIEQTCGQSVSRGAFYTTLDRLAAKGLVRWAAEPGGDRRDLQPQRRFRVTTAGLRELRASRRALVALWHGLDAVLGED